MSHHSILLADEGLMLLALVALLLLCTLGCFCMRKKKSYDSMHPYPKEPCAYPGAPPTSPASPYKVPGTAGAASAVGVAPWRNLQAYVHGGVSAIGSMANRSFHAIAGAANRSFTAAGSAANTSFNAVNRSFSKLINTDAPAQADTPDRV